MNHEHPTVGPSTGQAGNPADELDRAAAAVRDRLRRLLPERMSAALLAGYAGEIHWTYAGDAYEHTVAAPAWELIRRGGKSWRPLFCLLLAENMGLEMAPYVDLLTLLVELPHTGSLLVDDVEDNALTRRGQPCIHLQYGVDVAINAGNLLYFLPLLEIDRHPRLSPALKAELHAIVNRHYIRAHLGQAADIYWSRHLTAENLDAWLAQPDRLRDQLCQAYAFKTGAGICSVTACAAAIVGLTPSVGAVFETFARNFSVGFQIIDDVMNFRADAGWGKDCGEDLLAGKLTSVIIEALLALDPGGRDRLRDVLCRAERPAPERLAEGLALVRRSGALEACRQAGARRIGRAWNEFDAHLPPGRARDLLRCLCDKLMPGDQPL